MLSKWTVLLICIFWSEIKDYYCWSPLKKAKCSNFVTHNTVIIWETNWLLLQYYTNYVLIILYNNFCSVTHQNNYSMYILYRLSPRGVHAHTSAHAWRTQGVQFRFQMRSHWHFLFTAISVFHMPLAFCANGVTAVFSSLVLESWHCRRWRQKGNSVEFRSWGKKVRLSIEHSISTCRKVVMSH